MMAPADDDRTEGAGTDGPEANRPRESGEDIRERLSWFLASRRDAEGKLTPGLLAEASRQKREREHLLHDGARRPMPPVPAGPSGTLNWTPIGPSEIARGQATGNPPVSGRVNALALHPNGDRAYLASANGGVWFSGDGGAGWTPKDDYAFTSPGTSGLEADSLAAGGIDVRFAPTGHANDLIFVGTGEPQPFPSDAYFGIGVLRSADGGATWTREAQNLAGWGIYQMLIDPTSTAAQPPVFAATTHGLWQRPTSGPVTYWTQVTSPAFYGPDDHVCALIADVVGATRTYYIAFWNDENVYSSTDGATWTAIGGLPLGPGRVSLAAAQGVVYAFLNGGTLHRLDGGTFQQVAGTPPANVSRQIGGLVGTQGWYDLVVAVDPTNANSVYLAGADLWDGSDYNLSFFRGTITGSPGSFSFGFSAANNADPAGSIPGGAADPTWIGQGVHPDAHAMAFATNAAGTAVTEVWVCTDGGPFRSTTSGAPNGSFQPCNTGLAISQMTFMAERSDMDSVVFAGSQDNGTLRCFGEPTWFEAPEGDGGGVAVDPNNQYRLMRQYVNASLSRSTDGGQTKWSWSDVTTFPPANDLFENSATGVYAPLAVSPPGGTTLLAFGTNRLWLTADWGVTWATLPTNTNPYSTSPPNPAQDQLSGGPVTAIVFANATRIFAATSTSVYRFDLAGTTWSQSGPLAGLPSGAWIADLAVESATTVYAVLGGSGYDHVWYYNGMTFRSAGGTAGPTGLTKSDLDIPMHAVAVDPAATNTVFVGSDVGCWKGTKSGTSWSWIPFSSGLPECAITDLSVNDQSRLLRAATHGRGVWEIPIATGAVATDPDLYMRVNYADTGRISGGGRQPWVEGAQDPTKPGFRVYHWMSADIKVRRPSWPTTPDPLNTPPDYLDFAQNIDDYVSSIDQETADQPASLATGRFNRIFVQVHNRGLKAVAGSKVRVMLLVTPAAAGLPPLPANYAKHIQHGDRPGSPGVPGSGWLAGSAWYAADPASPYKSPPGAVDVRTPGVVEFNVDFTNIPSTALTDHVCAAAFVTTPADQLTAAQPSLDALTMQDKHVVHRNLHLVAAAAKPLVLRGGFSHTPQTIALDFYDATGANRPVDIVFERGSFPGRIDVMLSKIDHDISPRGFDVIQRPSRDATVRADVGHLLQWLGEKVEGLGERIERLADRVQNRQLAPVDLELQRRKLDDIDPTRIYTALSTAKQPTLSGVRIPPGRYVTALINLRAPHNARPGDHYRFDIIQQDGARILGGSTYVYVVVETLERSARQS
jgi:hypothetical protein